MLLDLTFDQLQQKLVAEGVRPAHTLAVWRALHREFLADLAAAGSPRGFAVRLHHPARDGPA